VITNTARRAFDVIEITNEMPLNRTGGVGTVIDNLIPASRRRRCGVWF
jgi:hypothetical protein